MPEETNENRSIIFCEFAGGTISKLQITGTVTPFQMLGLAGYLEASAKQMLIDSARIAQQQEEKDKIEVAKPKILKV